MDAVSPALGPVRELIGHLLDCISGFCAVLAAAEPQRLAHFAKLRESPASIEIYRAHIEEGFALLTDARSGAPHPHRICARRARRC